MASSATNWKPVRFKRRGGAVGSREPYHQAMEATHNPPSHYERAMSRKTGVSVSKMRKEMAEAKRKGQY